MEEGNRLLESGADARALVYFDRALRPQGAPAGAAVGEFGGAPIGGANGANGGPPGGPAWALYGRGTAYLRLGEWEAAREDLRAAHACAPADVAVLCQLAYVELHEGNAMEALSLYVDAWGVGPEGSAGPGIIGPLRPLLANAIELAVERARAQACSEEEVRAVAGGVMAHLALERATAPAPAPATTAATPVMGIPGATGATGGVSSSTPAGAAAGSAGSAPPVTRIIHFGGNPQITTTTSTSTSTDISAIIASHRAALGPDHPLNAMANVGSNIATAIDMFRSRARGAPGAGAAHDTPTPNDVQDLPPADLD